MDVTVKLNTKAPVSGGLSHPAIDIRRLGEWGRVVGLHSGDNTVDVVLDTGLFLKHIPVTSKEWVIPGQDVEKDYNSGERNLPPIAARVFIMMPSFTYGDCFVAPFSGFNTIDKNASAPFMEDDREKIKERITPSGWHVTDDYVTGSHKAVSPDGKTSLEIDYGNEEEPKEENPELHFVLFDNIELSVNQDSIKIKTKGDVSTEIDGKFYYGNKSENMCALFLALIDELINFQTFGPPPQHMTHPQTVMKLNAFKEKIKALFLESA